MGGPRRVWPGSSSERTFEDGAHVGRYRVEKAGEFPVRCISKGLG